MRIGRVYYPESFDDIIYLMDWGRGRGRLEQLTRSSHTPGFDFKATGGLVAIVRIKPKKATLTNPQL